MLVRLVEKSCGNCVNCDKISYDNWICEEFGFYHDRNGPVHCEPPHDEACELWTDDLEKKNSWEKRV